jgi:hypothetical protein
MSITTLPLDFSSSEGPTVYGHISRSPRPILKVYKSAIPLLDGKLSPARSTADKMDVAVPLYTGMVEYPPTAWANTGGINIRSDSPLPVNVIGIYGTLEGGVK